MPVGEGGGREKGRGRKEDGKEIEEARVIV